MAYGFNEKLSEGGAQYITTAGVIDGLKISKLEFVKSDSGSYLEIEVRNSSGQTAARRYYEPILGSSYGPKNETELNEAHVKFSKLCKNISTQYLGRAYEIPAQPDFESFVKKMISDIGNKINNVTLRGVLVWNTRGFITLRAFSPLFEQMDVPLEQSQLKIWKNEVVNQPAPKSQAEIEGSIAPTTDDLPF